MDFITRDGQRKLTVAKADLNEYAKGWRLAWAFPKKDGKGWTAGPGIWMFDAEARVLAAMPHSLVAGTIGRGKGGTRLGYGQIGDGRFEIVKEQRTKSGGYEPAGQSIRLNEDEFAWLRQTLAGKVQ